MFHVEEIYFGFVVNFAEEIKKGPATIQSGTVLNDILLQNKPDVETLKLWFHRCYGTELVLVTICCFIAAQEKRLDLHRSDLQNPLKINFAAVFEFNKIDKLKNGTERQKQTEINPGKKYNVKKLKSPCDFIFQIKCVQPLEILN